MSITENEALQSALEKVKAQKVNFGFMERFNVDENLEVIQALSEIQQYRAIGTVEEFKALKEYKAKMEMQYLDDINNPLEPLKLSSALRSEIRKYEYRKEHKPQDISPLDYTIIYALKHCLEEQMAET